MLYVDLKNNGNFTDAGETNYTSCTLTNGWVNLKLPALASTGTYPVQAVVTGLAGLVGTSSIGTSTVVSNTSPWSGSYQIREHDPYDGLAQENLGVVSVSNPLDLDLSPGTQQVGNPALVYNSDRSEKVSA